jgi:hypothetical protein
MRFVLLPIAIATLAVAAATGQQAPHPIVILVHGRGHAGEDTAALRREWKEDLDSGLVSVKSPPLSDGDVRLAYYADVLDPEYSEGCRADSLVVNAMGFETLTREVIAGIASLISKDVAPEARGILGDVLYVADGTRRCAAGARLGAALRSAAQEQRPIIVIAYSLGALVAYDYLSSAEARDLSGVRLITIGSPLGVPEIRELLGHGSDALRLPTPVTEWDNVYDPGDAFSASIAAAVRNGSVRDRATRAPSSSDAHYIRRYLRDPETATALTRALGR